MSQIARMFEAYFTILERQAVQLEGVASKLGDEGQRSTVLDCIAAIRHEVHAMREQIRLLGEWG